VDFALKPTNEKGEVQIEWGFNPCFGGFCSKTETEKTKDQLEGCFNPCFGGFCSKTLQL